MNRTRNPRQKELLNQAFHQYTKRYGGTLGGVEQNLGEKLYLSAASIQKWRYGYQIAESYLPKLITWAVQQAGMNQRWFENFCYACEYQNLELQSQLFSATEVQNLTDLDLACQQVNKRLWGETTGPPEPYFLRHRPVELVKAFLDSDRPGLILVGASGLGKTSFALWLANAGHKLQRPVLLLRGGMLDGNTKLEDLIVRNLQIAEISSKIRGDPLSWPILFIIDGINESPEMARLTWQVNRSLPRAQGIKVMLTFRPESFQLVRNKMSAHLYFNNINLSPPSSLRLDPPAIRILPFQSEELPLAFELYKKAYGVKTSFTSLTDTLRKTLSNPLTMQILSTTYEGKYISLEATTEKVLIPKLLDSYIERGSLKHIDIYIVTDYLVPLMLGKNNWRNAVTMTELRKYITEGQTSLSQDVLQDCFTRLADAGVLASTNGKLEQPIRFNHESYLEYFAYRFIHHQYILSSDTFDYLAKLATAPTFLYGPIRKLILLEMSEHSTEWFSALLAILPEVLSADLLVKWCHDHTEIADDYLLKLWQKTHKPMSFFKFWGNSQYNYRTLSKQLVILDAASKLGNVMVLKKIILNGSPQVRATSIVEAAKLWQADIPSAKRLIDDLTQHVFNLLGLPNLKTIIDFSQLILLSFISNSPDTEITDHLLYQAGNIFRQLFTGYLGNLLQSIIVEKVARWIELATVKSGDRGSHDPYVLT